jgi:hypothetical protein
MSCEADKTIEAAMDVDALLATEDGVSSFDGALSDLVCASWSASGRPLRKTPKIQLLDEAAFKAARDSHPVFKGRDVPGFIVHDPSASAGQQECIVLPTTWPAAEFVEVMQHEVGHVRQSERGEQEAELAEIVQALTTAQLHPRFGARLLEAIFDIKVGFKPNIVGHAHALMTLAANGGDFAGAHDGLVGWSDTQGIAALKASCGCEDPLAESAYAGFARPFVDAVSGFTPVPGASAGEGLDDIQAFLRWRLAFALNEIDGDDGPYDYMSVVDATDDYIAARDTPGLHHAWVTRLATQHLAAGATPATGEVVANADRLALWRRIIDLNIVYPAQDGDDDAERYNQYLSAFSAAAGNAAAPPAGSAADPETLIYVSDTFLERHGADHADGCIRQVAAEVFMRRGTQEFGANSSGCAPGDNECIKPFACAGLPWFERSAALLGWSEADSCGVALNTAEITIDTLVASQSEAARSYGCDG